MVSDASNELRATMNDHFNRVDRGVAEALAGLDGLITGQQQIIGLIQGLIDDRNESGPGTR
ncbi:hypothetical protein KIH27_11140 [Mycobacterium sp. M1]|uniref:WXG100 family type VII secretion target n=1 Tax=Mycolicibacter acidiphilus TaxID=2835306 RepID=A0ABS5RIP4_9MYCO|nr:hypothetical protein [Mycolicibacter acidiphilus]MBS9534140.1 hypothetical protein [Mycolicibacter acidiphilus]